MDNRNMLPAGQGPGARTASTVGIIGGESEEWHQQSQIRLYKMGNFGK